MNGFWYLASPYSAYEAGLSEAHRVVCREAARLIAAGWPIFSPIAHAHPICEHGNLDPLAHDFWLSVDRPMMAAAGGLVVLQMKGWEQSKGLLYELDTFRAAKKPIAWMTPGKLPEMPAAAEWVGVAEEAVGNPITAPAHYRSANGIECIDVIEAFGLDFRLGNAVKYLLRAGKKGDGGEDLRKARAYLNRAIDGDWGSV